MDTETTEGGVDTTNNEGEGESSSDTITLSKSDWEKHNQTLGSLKRELKDLKKPKEETKDTSTTNQKPDESHLLKKLENMALRTAGITHPDDIELARKTAEKWKVDIDEVLSDDDFKVKLEKQQSNRSNVEATSNVKGSGAGASQAKNTAEYWIGKGHPPKASDVPDRKVRAKILRAFMDQGKGMGENRYYNQQ